MKCRLLECTYCYCKSRGSFLNISFWDYFCRWDNAPVCEGQECFISLKATLPKVEEINNVSMKLDSIDMSLKQENKDEL